MVLNADDVGVQRNVLCGGAASFTPEFEIVALEDVALVQRAHNLLWFAEILVISCSLSGQVIGKPS